MTGVDIITFGCRLNAFESEIIRRAAAGRGAGGGGGFPRPRASLQVQQGCDPRCTFCIIPFARGPSRSVPLATIADQARELVAGGVREIVLTGVDLTAYGGDLPDTPS